MMLLSPHVSFAVSCTHSSTLQLSVAIVLIHFDVRYVLIECNYGNVYESVAIVH